MLRSCLRWSSIRVLLALFSAPSGLFAQNDTLVVHVGHLGRDTLVTFREMRDLTIHTATIRSHDGAEPTMKVPG